MNEVADQNAGVVPDGTPAPKSGVINISFSVKKKSLMLTGVAVGAVALAGIAFAAFSNSQPSVLAIAVNECDLTDNEYVSVDKNGKGIFIDGEGEESLGLAIEDIGCLLSEIDVPDSVINKMSSTTAMMGAQEAEFEGIIATWSYHPDNGLDIGFSTN